MFDRRLVQNFDWVLLGLVVIICATGIVNLYSAGYNRGEGTPLYVKQLYWLAVGLGVMFVTLTYDYRHLEKLSYPLYILSILLLVAVMFGGKMVSGSRRWLPLGPLAFQPAEIAKIGIILAMAAYFNRRPRMEAMGLKELIVPGVLVMIPVALIIHPILPVRRKDGVLAGVPEAGKAAGEDLPARAPLVLQSNGIFAYHDEII